MTASSGAERIQTIEATLTRDRHAPRHARQLISDLIGMRASREFVSDATLLTNEFVTNAVEYTVGGCGLWACFDAVERHLRVEIADDSRFIPVASARKDRRAVGGFGLALVQMVSSRSGGALTSTGKRMWFELVDEL